MSASRFLLVFAAFVVGLMALAAGFNAVVDPYLLIGMPRWSRFNAVKPAVETHEGLMKAYEAPRHQARTLILGSSRTDLGLDPAHAGWPAELQPVYNLSRVGVELNANLRALRHMVATNGQQVKTQVLVVGLDFESFLARPAQAKVATPENSASEGDAERLAIAPDGSPDPARIWRRVKDVATGLATLGALSDSVEAVLANWAASAPDLEPSGHLSEGRFRQWKDADGYATLFAQKNSQTVKSYLSPHRPLGKPGDPDGMGPLQKLLAYAAEHGMRVVLAIQPAHASRLELLDAMGYWPEYEQWKRALSLHVAQARAAGQDVTLWDFGSYEYYALEPIPPDSDRHTLMKWYWDPVHYSAALGDMMVQRMLTNAEVPGVGVQLTPAMLESHLAMVRADRLAYRSAHPGEMERIRKSLCVSKDQVGCAQ